MRGDCVGIVWASETAMSNPHPPQGNFRPFPIFSVRRNQKDTLYIRSSRYTFGLYKKLVYMKLGLQKLECL